MNSLAQPKTFRLLPALLAVIAATLFSPPAQAQNSFGTLTTLHVYGVIQQYPSNGDSIYTIAPDGTFSTVHVLTYTEGSDTESSLPLGSDGFIYGVGRLAANPYEGTIFQLRTDGTFTLLHSLVYAEGAGVGSTLFQGTNGYFYGTTAEGGDNGNGTLFKIDTTGNLIELYSFTVMDGYGPSNGLIQATDGNFYGTSPDGGGSNGTTGPSGFYAGIYRFGSGGFTILHRFVKTDAPPTARRRSFAITSAARPR